MKAVICKAYGPPESLVVEEIEPLTPRQGQVVISVKACGVNFPDTLIIQGLYQFKPPLPFSPGAEVAGVVKAVGAGVEHVALGDRVISIAPYGGFAEEVIAEAAAVIPMPDEMDFDIAASFAMTYGTDLHALNDRAHLQPGETLLVLGAAGGIGLAAVELGKVLGARVIAAASSDEKLAMCRQYGADATINYVSEDLKERIKVINQWPGGRCGRRPRRRTLLRAGAPRHGLEWALPGDWFHHRRHPTYPAQPATPEGLLNRRRLLGQLHRSRSPTQSGQPAPTPRLAAGRQAQTAHLRQVSPGTGS